MKQEHLASLPTKKTGVNILHIPFLFISNQFIRNVKSRKYIYIYIYTIYIHIYIFIYIIYIIYICAFIIYCYMYTYIYISFLYYLYMCNIYIYIYIYILYACMYMYIYMYIYVYICIYIYIYIYIHLHVFRPSQDSSVWLGLTSRRQLMSPECSKHEVLGFAKMLVVWWTDTKYSVLYSVLQSAQWINYEYILMII